VNKGKREDRSSQAPPAQRLLEEAPQQRFAPVLLATYLFFRDYSLAESPG
jgi:hypothetical protein